MASFLGINYVNKAVENIDVSNLKRVAMDETARAKGHKYVTLFVDIDTNRLYLSQGERDRVLKDYELLDNKEVSCDQITDFCYDMSPSFISEIDKSLPGASITFGKLHVIKMVYMIMQLFIS